MPWNLLTPINLLHTIPILKLKWWTFQSLTLLFKFQFIVVSFCFEAFFLCHYQIFDNASLGIRWLKRLWKTNLNLRAPWNFVRWYNRCYKSYLSVNFYARFPTKLAASEVRVMTGIDIIMRKRLIHVLIYIEPIQEYRCIFVWH